MKKAALILLAFVTVLFSCTSKSKSSFSHSPADTSKIYLIYGKFGTGMVPAEGIKISKDSLSWVEKDSTSKKKEWSRVPVYYYAQLDTMYKSKGVPDLDSSGKVKMGFNYYFVPTELVLGEMNNTVDSMTRRWQKLMGLIPKDTSQNKK